jgi:hypothetical protein
VVHPVVGSSVNSESTSALCEATNIVFDAVLHTPRAWLSTAKSTPPRVPVRPLLE